MLKVIQYTLSFHSTLRACESESEVAQSCPTLCDPMDCSLPGSLVHGIFQARILEWAAISFSRGSSQPRDWTRVSRIAGRRFTVWAISRVQLFVTPWTVAYHTPPSMGFSRQKCWSGLPFLKMVQNLPTSCTSCRLNPHDQLGRLYAGPTAGPETSTALEGILGRQGRLRLSVRKRTPTAVIQENER